MLRKPLHTDLVPMKAVIDRIGEMFAVLVFPEEENLRLNLPLALLPAGCCEGDILTLSVERDEAATHEAQDRVSGLIGDLIRQYPVRKGGRKT